MSILLLGAAGCGEKKAADEQASVSQESAPSVSSQLPPADVTAKTGESMIEPSGQEFPVEGLFLNPYFDEAGTQTELAVKPDEPFRFYIFAETVEPYSTNAVQYRLSLPAGIEIMGNSEFEHKSVSTGDPKVSYMLAYDCQPAGRFRLVTYICRATQEFKGGEIEVLAALPANGIDFIGFVSCEFVEMRAAGGKATLTRN
jgi:hypothetical protein